MKATWLSRTLTIGLSAGILTAFADQSSATNYTDLPRPGEVVSGNSRTVTTHQTTRGTQNGVRGSWVTVTQQSFKKSYPSWVTEEAYNDAVRNAAGGDVSGLNDNDWRRVMEWWPNSISSAWKSEMGSNWASPGNAHQRTIDPLVLDLNGNGEIDVTGKSAAKFRAKENMTFVAQGSVMFDLKGTGKPIRTEWIKQGDGFLVDNRNNRAVEIVKQGKDLSIVNLFGDDGGHLSGFRKLAYLFDPNGKVASTDNPLSINLGVLKGKTLDDMLVWIDDGDGKATVKELHTLSSLGITEIKLPSRVVQNQQGEYLERATFTRKGKVFNIQEVWFANQDEE
ncbi:hypothetical protein J7643_14150 [bacterium]|nr:hypothetical protein [bacterium]